MTSVNITASPRSDFGKGAARRTRRAGQVPAVLYGTGKELVHVSLPAHDLDLALRKPRVVLAVSLEGKTYQAKPRDIQRDPVKLNLEHVDLIIISDAEAKTRSEYADAVAQAHAAAEEAGYDAASVVQAMEEAIAAGEDPMAAAQHAVADVKEHTQAQAETNAAEDAAATSEAAAGEAPAEA